MTQIRAIHVMPGKGDPDINCEYCEEPSEFECSNCQAPLCDEHGGSYSHESEDPGVRTHTWCLDEMDCEKRYKDWLR